MLNAKKIRKFYPINLILITYAICLSCSHIFAGETRQEKDPGKMAFCQRDNQYWQIWAMNLDGSGKKQLTHSAVDLRSPNFSSDGKKIVYATNEGKLWVMDSDGNNKKQIPLNIDASEPRWCFKDSKIIFTGYRGITFLDDSDIWMVNNDGTHLEKIIRRPSIQFLPQVSENGEEIVFVDVLESIGHEIMRLDLKTKDYTQLTDDDSRHTTPVFTPDGGSVVYSSDRDGNYDIWVMDKFGRNQASLTRRPAFDSSPVVSKDGKTIYFLSDETKRMQIWRIDIDGGNLAQITNDDFDKQDIDVFAP